MIRSCRCSVTGTDEKEPFGEEPFILRGIAQEFREEFRHIFFLELLRRGRRQKCGRVKLYIVQSLQATPVLYHPMTTNNLGLSNFSDVSWM